MLHLKYNKIFHVFHAYSVFFVFLVFFASFFCFSTAAAIFFHIFNFYFSLAFFRDRLAFIQTLIHTHNVSRNPSANYSWIILLYSSSTPPSIITLIVQSYFLFFLLRQKDEFFQQFFRPHLGRINAWLRGFSSCCYCCLFFLCCLLYCHCGGSGCCCYNKIINIMNYTIFALCVLRHVS